jgi:hypothetical protein
VILVGANEKPRGTLSGYVKMTQAEAAQVKSLYEKRARNLCSPMPVVDAHPIDRGNGEWVVAVNVEAYSAPPIGVRSPGDAGNNRLRYSGAHRVFMWGLWTDRRFYMLDEKGFVLGSSLAI